MRVELAPRCCEWERRWGLGLALFGGGMLTGAFVLAALTRSNVVAAAAMALVGVLSFLTGVVMCCCAPFTTLERKSGVLDVTAVVPAVT